MDPVLIEIKQDRPGFNNFISSWLLQGKENILVDVGPSSSAHRLVDTLRRMNIDRLDYILITHIHMDHAGGLANILDRYPMAKVVCHSKAVRHLVDPAKLWAGSLKALGDVVMSYGPIRPVDEKRLIPHDAVHIENLEITDTPGHAPHHLSFTYDGRLLAGEAGGTYCALAGQEYLRPATPPVFFFDVSLASIDRLLAQEDLPIFYAHFGMAESSHRLLNRHREQLFRWREMIKNEISNEGNNIVTRCVERVLEDDPDLQAFRLMDPDTQERERFFITNSARGYVELLKDGK